MTGRRLAPGPPATAADLLAAQERHRLLSTELTRVRNAATAWRNALAVLLTGLVGFGLIKGRSDVGLLARPWAVGVGVILLCSLLSGAVGALLLVRSAHGAPTVAPLSALQVRSAADHLEARTAARALRRGMAMALLCAGLLVTAVAVTWYGPTPVAKPPVVQVSTPTAGQVCGTVVRVDQGKLTLKTAAGEVVTDLTEASALQALDACPAPAGAAGE
ncbi:hypothetical protein GCM10010306_103400 [Streptomyces umbrinus]|uniref:hypothetical protein n=1 Tax=Streptomyces umbrinus TaxID=67370 RepID=UPI00167B4F72|nr:hypothetical protein [Streptomyces umbrinus]GHB91555.1 hypothetical protein GCM10010306_103400 [Streptomyces umbrinus]